MSRKKKPQKGEHQEQPQVAERPSWEEGGMSTFKDLNWELLWNAVDDAIHFMMLENENAYGNRHPECLYYSAIHVAELAKALWAMEEAGLIPRAESSHPNVVDHHGPCYRVPHYPGRLNDRPRGNHHE